MNARAELRELSRQIPTLLDCQRRVLELIGSGAPLDEVLLTIVKLVEQLAPEIHCAILRVNSAGQRLDFSAAPSIPDDFKACVAPFLRIGPDMANCGRAAFWREPIYTEDTAMDSRWMPCREVALRNGLRAAWSTPVVSDHDTVLGTFAMFYRKPGLPNHRHVQLIDMAVQMARVAIQSKLDEERLRASEKEARDVIDNIPVIAWTARPGGPGEFTNRSWQEYTGQGAEEAAGWGWTTTVHPEDVEKHLANWHRAVESGKLFESEARYRRTDGTYRWFLARGVPRRDEQGNVHRWYGILADIDDRKRTEGALQQSACRLQQLSRQLLGVREEESRNLARELHDRLGATLTALSINLAALKERTATDREAQARVADSAMLLKSTALAIESMVAELRPPMLDDHGLAAALEWYGRQFSDRVGVTVTVRAVEPGLRVTPEADIALFRIAEEALNNVAKHARAKRVAINLWRTDGEFVMSMADDGVGLSTGDTTQRRGNGLGMVTMRERAHAIGGCFEIEGLPEGGTRVSVRVPV